MVALRNASGTTASLILIFGVIATFLSQLCSSYVAPSTTSPLFRSHIRDVTSPLLPAASITVVKTNTLKNSSKGRTLGGFPFRSTNSDYLSSLSSADDSQKPSESSDKSEKEEEEEVSNDELTPTEKEEVVTLASRIKTFFRNFGGKKSGEDDGLTTRQRLAKMGLSALLSYGWVSNMSYSIALSISWYAFSKKTGLSPLAPGQWKGFLAVYAGFYVFNNIVRPLRVALAVAITKYFDDIVDFIQRKTNASRAVSIALVVFLANFCGTLAAMAAGVSLASAASGVPIFPPKA